MSEELQKIRNSMIDGSFVSVKDFGAKGDGVADDTVAIQRAIDVGNKVFFSDGDYILGAILIDKPMIIYGSPNTKIRKKEGSYEIFNIQSKDVEIRNIHFYSLNYLFQSTLLYLENASNVLIEKCKFNDEDLSKEHACIKISSGCSNIKIIKNTIKNGAFMIFLITACKKLIATNNYFEGGSTRGVLKVNEETWEIVSVGDAFKFSTLAGGSEAIITNNIFYDIYRDAIDTFMNGSRIVFSNNIAINCGTLLADIKITNENTLNEKSKDIIISDNIIIDCFAPTKSDSQTIYIGTSLYDGDIDITELVDRVIIKNNIITGGVRHGIRVFNALNVIIEDNIITNIPKRSIYVHGVTEGVSIKNNKITLNNINTTLEGIYISTVTGNLIVESNEIKAENSTMNALLSAVTGVFIANENVVVKNNNMLSMKEGIIIQTASNNLIVNSNIIKKSSTSGIRVYQTNKLCLKDNVMQNCQRIILYSGSVTNSLIAENTGFDCVTGYIGQDNIEISSINRNNENILSV